MYNLWCQTACAKTLLGCGREVATPLVEVFVGVGFGGLPTASLQLARISGCECSTLQLAWHGYWWYLQPSLGVKVQRLLANTWPKSETT